MRDTLTRSTAADGDHWRSQTQQRFPGSRKSACASRKARSPRTSRCYVSNDGKKIVQGNFYDVATNPFKPDLDKLKTQFQPALGTAGAPVAIVVFSDLQCPHCKGEAEMLRKNLIQNYPTQVRLYFKDFPARGPAPVGQGRRHGGPLRLPAEATTPSGHTTTASSAHQEADHRRTT